MSRTPLCRSAAVAALLLLTLCMQRFAAAVDLWAVHIGHPQTPLPAEEYKFLDANEACQSLPYPPPRACDINFRNMRSFGGPQAQDGCVYDHDCVCTSICLPELNPRISSTGWFTSRRPQVCPAGTTPYLGRCDVDTAKSKGPCLDCDLVRGNPANIASGNKFQAEPVYRAGSGPLALELFYNSQPGVTYFRNGPLGAQWTMRYLTRVRDSSQGIIAVQRPDGRELEFRSPLSGNVYRKDADIADTLEKLTGASGQITGWRFVAAQGDEVEEYDAAGKLRVVRDRAGVEQVLNYSPAGLLIDVSDRFGRQLRFGHDAQQRISTMRDAGGGEYVFEYDDANNLTRIVFPDTRFRRYSYAEAAHINGGAGCASPAALSNLLTGLNDENGERYATWTYDCQGRATGSQHALGAQAYRFIYGNGVRDVLDALDTSRTVTLQRFLGVARAASTVQPAASGAGTAVKSASFDANGNPASSTDYNGNRTNYIYDLARNLETSRTEGLASSGAPTPQARTITTAWHAIFRLPVQVAEPLRITTNVYDADGTACGARGALCARSVQATNDSTGAQGLAATPVGAPRTWTYTYNANGSMLTADGPRSDVADVTTYTYYANDDADLGKRGNLATVTDAAGHTTRITAYNAHGQPLTTVDANGLATIMTYDARQRLKTRAVGNEATSYDYDGVGQLVEVTLPDGSVLSYEYDAAHRLTGMRDNAGNRIAYTLDAMGNRAHEQVFDPANQLAQTRSRVYNGLNRLFRELGARGQVTEYGYDNQGNVSSVKDPLERVRSNQYDALNRLEQVTDPALGVTRYGYDGLDALTQVSDPRGLVTGYLLDGLGNLALKSSPDTGNTASTHDAAGNLLTHTDAKGQVTAYAYDALSRVTRITFDDGSTQAYAYDQGANGRGRLSSITEIDPASQPVSVVAYAYDPHGRVTSETRTVAGVQYVLGYDYDPAGRLAGLVYPSGRRVAYEFDALGRVSGVTTTKDGETQAVASDVSYHPFGGVKAFTLGNGQRYARTHDQDGRITSYTLGGAQYAIGYDAAGRIEFISETANPVNSNTYGYDSLDRLTSAVVPGTPFAYSYDAVGNRIARTVGAASETLAYSPTSNRLASLTPASGPVRNFAFDANGSTTSDGENTYAYDARGRLVQATSVLGTTRYQFNALGQRIRKTSGTIDRVFLYDTRGRLIAEADPQGTTRRELIYLGDLPIAVVQ